MNKPLMYRPHWRCTRRNQAERAAMGFVRTAFSFSNEATDVYTGVFHGRPVTRRTTTSARSWAHCNRRRTAGR
jgi:hypothetical protein